MAARRRKPPQPERDDGLSLDLDLDLDLDLSTDDDGPAVADPLAGVEYEGNAEADAPKEMSALLTAFKGKAAAEQQRFQNATDSQYWFAVCFQTQAQKLAFLEAVKWAKLGNKYLDGIKLAKLMGVTLPPADIRFGGEKPDRKMAELPTIDD